MIHARDDYNRIQDPAGKIGHDEPVFLLRAQDRYFIPMLVAYREHLLANRLYDMAHLIDEHIDRAKIWQRFNTTKIPDVPKDTTNGQ